MKLPKLNWRSALHDIRAVLLVLLLAPIVLFSWLQAVACARASSLSPGCLLSQQQPSFYAAPKARGGR